MPNTCLNDQEAAVALALIQQAGTLVEFWGDLGDAAVDPEFARTCLARWLKDLPGTAWDLRLGSHPYDPAPAPDEKSQP